MAEIRARAKLIDADADAKAIEMVESAKKAAVNDISPAALQLMIAKEIAKALANGNSTMISTGVQDTARMMGVMSALRQDT